MKRSVVSGESCAQPCADYTVRSHAICAVLDQDELRQFKQLGHRLRYRSNESVFSQEEAVTSCYNVVEGVMRLYKLLPDGRRQIVGFALPGDFLGLSATERYAISADAVGPSWFAVSSKGCSRASPKTGRTCCVVSTNFLPASSQRPESRWCCSGGGPPKRRSPVS